MKGALLLLLLGAQDAFVDRGVFDGVTVSARQVEGSSFAELRFTATSHASLALLCQRAFSQGQGRGDEPYLVSREILSDGPDERVTYERIAPPLVSQRDYVVRRWKRSSPHQCRVDFASVDDAPVREGWMRLKHLEGSFVFDEAPDGAVHVEHRIHMDPGGLLTPVLVEPTRQEMGLKWMLGLLRAGVSAPR